MSRFFLNTIILYNFLFTIEDKGNERFQIRVYWINICLSIIWMSKKSQLALRFIIIHSDRSSSLWKVTSTPSFQLELLTRKTKLLWPQAASQNTTNDIHWVGLMHKSHLCLEKSQGLFLPSDKALLHPNESNPRGIKFFFSPSCLSFFIAYFMAVAVFYFSLCCFGYKNMLRWQSKNISKLLFMTLY